MNQTSYRMKVVVLDGSCAVYVNETMVCSTTLPDYYRDGYLGIGAAEGSKVTFQNTRFTALGDETLAKITDITARSVTVRKTALRTVSPPSWKRRTISPSSMKTVF